MSNFWVRFAAMVAAEVTGILLVGGRLNPAATVWSWVALAGFIVYFAALGAIITEDSFR